MPAVNLHQKHRFGDKSVVSAGCAGGYAVNLHQTHIVGDMVPATIRYAGSSPALYIYIYIYIRLKLLVF
jgi:hypothetical protein